MSAYNSNALNILPTDDVIITNDLYILGDLKISNSQTPATAGATGTIGSVAWDASYIYVCTGANTWKRSALSTW